MVNDDDDDLLKTDSVVTGTAVANMVVLMFQLKPYVSYTVSDVSNDKFTARDLFNSTYAKRITDDFNSGKLELDTVTETTKTFKSSDSK